MRDSSDTAREFSSSLLMGTIAEVDAPQGLCRVQAGDITTDWVPWFVPRAGATIEWSAPSTGELVLLMSTDGDTHGAVALRGLYSDSFPAPASEASKHLTRYKDGAEIEYEDASHALRATLPSGATAEITADAGITINGPVTVNGDVNVSKTLTAQTDVIGGGKSLKGHRHVGVQTGSGVSGAPQ